MPTAILTTVGAFRSALVAADNAFAWLVDPREHDFRAAMKAVPPPPPPEKRVALAVPPPAPVYGEAFEENGGALVAKPASRKVARGQKVPLMAWKEIDDLRGALADNRNALHRLSLDHASRDAEEKVMAKTGEQAVTTRQKTLRKLREKMDAAPAARAARLAELHAQVRAASAALEELRAAESLGREAAEQEERVAWEGAEERAASYAADAAREQAAAEAAEEEEASAIYRLRERLAHLEDDHAGTAGGGAPAPSRRQLLGLRRDELTSRRVAVSPFTHEPPRALGGRLAAMRRGGRMKLRGLSGGAGGGAGGEVMVRLSEDRPPAMLVRGTTPSGEVSLALPLSRCIRICIGRAEDHTLPWAFPVTLEQLGAPPAPPPDASEHLCLTLLFAPDAAVADAAAVAPSMAASGAALAVHLVATNRVQLEDWYLGCQPLAALWPGDRVAPGVLRWRALRLRARRERARKGRV